MFLTNAIASLALLLGSGGAVIPPPNINAEIECLSEAVYHEARGESIEGQLAVANVIINRVRSEKYPNSVCDVVEQRSRRTCQFSYFCLKNLKVRDRVAYENATMVSVIALRSLHYGGNVGALAGYPERCFGSDVLWYHTKDVSPVWNRKLNTACVIDNHIFFKSPTI